MWSKQRDIRHARQEKADTLAQWESILDVCKGENRKLTPEEQKRIAAMSAKVDTLNNEIEKRELDRERQRLQPSRAVLPGGGLGPLEYPDAAAGCTKGKRYVELFGASLGNDGWPTFNDYLAAVSSGVHHPQLRSAMGEKVPSAGGFFVPEEFTAEMLDASLEKEIVRPRCQVFPMQAQTKKIAGWDASDNSGGALFGGFTAQWLDEAGTITESTAKVRLIELKAKKLALFTKSSNELIQDGMSFEQMLSAAMVEATAWNLDYACLRGVGAFQPLGVLNDPALIAVTPEDGQTAGTILYDNLVKMYARLHPALHNGAVWVANSTAIPQLLLLTITGGTASTHFPVLRETEGRFFIFGKEMCFSEKLPGLGTKGDIVLCNFSQYALGIRKEVILEKSIHVGFQTDESAYRVILRADGQGRWNAAYKPKTGDTLSWCVAIADRT